MHLNRSQYPDIKTHDEPRIFSDQVGLMEPSVWNLLHDGTIKHIDGAIPGDVSLHVSTDYLRKRFPGEGAGFLLHLERCSHFTFTPYDEPAMSDLAAIAALTPWIVGCDSSDPLEVHCAEGTLTLRYDACTLSLDSGETITISQLDEAASSYWNEWSARRSRP